MPADMTLVDVLGTDAQALYEAGQTLVVLEGMQVRYPQLRVLLLDSRPPRMLALSAGRIHLPPPPIPAGTDLPHTTLLRGNCLRELALEPLDLDAVVDSVDLYEVRLSEVAVFCRVTWEVAAAADEVVAAQAERPGLFARLGRRGASRERAQLAEEGRERALEQLVRLAAQLPVRELTVTS